MARSGVLVAFALGLLSACGEDEDDTGGASSCVRVCKTVAPCEGITTAECEESFCPLQFPQACVDAVEAASCEDTVQDMPSYQDLCFPPCGDAPATCNGDDTVTLCAPFPDQNRTAVAPCPDICQKEGLTYTGTCGVSYLGQPSPTGEDVCFCQ